MKWTRLRIPDVILVEPDTYSDSRGWFFESYNHRVFEKSLGRRLHFVQDNQSHSKAGVLRGLHYQLGHPQAKLVRVLSGEIFDVAVDVRRSSPTFGQWEGVLLSAENRRQLWVPEGFAHGFVVVSDSADVLYKVTDYWSRESERTIIWNDPHIAIRWPTRADPILSDKDRCGSSLRDAELFA